MQQGDVLLFQTNDGGEINVTGGKVELSGGLPSAVYLSLFGGNEDDEGGRDTTLSWWGNRDELQPERQYRSETQNLLQAIVAIPANLRRLEGAANSDLAWLVAQKVATSVTVTASMPALNKIKLTIEIGGDLTVEFVENWKARS